MKKSKSKSVRVKLPAPAVNTANLSKAVANQLSRRVDDDLAALGAGSTANTDAALTAAALRDISNNFNFIDSFRTDDMSARDYMEAMEYGSSRAPSDRYVLDHIYRLMTKYLNPRPEYNLSSWGRFAPVSQYERRDPHDVIKQCVHAIQQHLGITNKPSHEMVQAEPEPDLYVVIEDGEVFAGTQAEFAETYDIPGSRQSIEEFCRDNSWKLEIS